MSSRAPSASLAVAGSVVALAIAASVMCCPSEREAAAEPAKAEPAKLEPSKPEPSKPEPSKPEPSKPAEPAKAVAGMGVVRGVVKLAKSAPSIQTYDVPAGEQPPCHGAKHTPPLCVVGADGGLANVIVRIKKADVPKDAIPAGWQPKQDHVVDQTGCEYAPHVSVAAVGQKVVFKNSDPTLHNVKMMSENPAVSPGTSIERTWKSAQRVMLACSVHPWMAGAVEITDHPWCVVTDANGRFELPPLPPGTYHVQAWHELVRDSTIEKDGIEVKIAKDETSDITITYK